MGRLKPDTSVVAKRAKDITAQGDTQTWLVASTDDCLELKDGRVPPEIRAQVVRWLQRDPTETTEQYAERLTRTRLRTPA